MCAGQSRELFDKIRGNSIKAADKLRLGLLYVLRYETQVDVSALKRELVDGGVPAAKVELVDALLKHGGKMKRAPGLYGDGSFMSRMAKNLQTGIAGVENVSDLGRGSRITIRRPRLEANLPFHFGSVRCTRSMSPCLSTLWTVR